MVTVSQGLASATGKLTVVVAWTEQAPIETTRNKIFTVVDYFGCQLAHKLGSTAPAYLKKEVVTPHPVAYKHSLQRDERPNWRISMRVWTWNVGSQRGKRGGGCEEIKNKSAGVFYLQEVRWRSQFLGCWGVNGKVKVMVILKLR